MLVGAAASGDDIVLTGGTRRRGEAYEEFVAAVEAVEADVSEARLLVRR